MRSKRSCFEWGLSRDLLRRAWPLWAAFFIISLLILPNAAEMARRTETYTDVLSSLYPMDRSPDYLLLRSGRGMLLLSFFWGLLAAWVHFGYLFETRSCGLMNSLPVRRESCFFTVWLTGLVPMLLVQLLAGLICYAQLAPYGLRFANFSIWLLVCLCGDLIFYGTAVLCAMLTGSRVLYPLLYLGISFAVPAVDLCLSYTWDRLLYGHPGTSESGALLFSPLVMTLTGFDVKSQPQLHVEGLGLLIGYGVAGLVLSALALLLYRRRHMETATDAIAVPWLKKIFPYLLGGIGAFYAVTIVGGIGAFEPVPCRRIALAIAPALLLGAFLCYFGARMLLQKSVRAFRGNWRGFLALCGALLLVLTATELDLFGYERRVPDPAKVEEVYVSTGGLYGEALSSPGALEAVRAAHQSFVDHKAEGEEQGGMTFSLTYTMKNGTVLERSYHIGTGSDWGGGEPCAALDALINCDEAIDLRNAAKFPEEGKSFTVHLQLILYDKSGEPTRCEYGLGKRGQDLYREAMLPDAAEHRLGREWLFTFDDEAYEAACSNVEIEIRVLEDRERYDGSAETVVVARIIKLPMDAERCIRWIEENTNIHVRSLAEAKGKSTVQPAGER
ncbi:MAG: hypothetical protein IK095_02135 [Oscillospiraceae bacterium]|nr:hypothetical protein [Oscillospiraceae bacterium]